MSFAVLPPELQAHIVSLACRFAVSATPPSSSSLSSSARQSAPASQRVALNFAQALTLATVSCDCLDLIRQILYRNLRIVRPSTLRRLHATFASHPALAELVNSLHVGSEEDIDQQGWPFLVENQFGDWPELYLQMTITGLEAEAALPRWVKPGHAWNLVKPKRNCKDMAIHHAMQSAMEQLDVEPWRREYDKIGLKIGVRAWAARLFQLQAALDLYLMEMRRVDDKEGYKVDSWRTPKEEPILVAEPLACKQGTCGHYPQLKIRPTPLGENHLPIARAANVKSFAITRQQLWAHMARSGRHFDHFDHLLLLTRSTREALGMTDLEWHLVHNDLGGPHHSLFTNDEWQAKMGGDPYDDGMDEDDAASQSSDEVDWGYEDVNEQVETVEELLQLARDVFAQTKNVSNLSVTSFFHRALPALQNPQLLRSLTIGPKARHWADVLPDSFAKGLSKLGRLRVCGMMSSKDAAKIASKLPALKTMVWEMTKERGYTEKAVEVIQSLQGQNSTSKTPQQHQKRTTEVRLHPKIRNSIMHDPHWGNLPTPAVRRAWAEGRLVRGALHSVKVVSSKAVVTSDPPLWSDLDREVATLYREGREWWEKARVGVDWREW